ncbi:MAG: hypothetical protein VYA09_03835 [Candidatus Neomarinimicrobiota bacterium]|uniref:Uncharacterized protein n=1 Tax=marine metagenome TaxID=408172 RepID=A0A381SED5_9ZZZZ|nr:hypothetical protein [Candidatus Neomarinimicrobiota bacterium]MEC9274436.1 hypothetical protein [Candidatus Neomarinimicrobiota bacterium]MEE3196716.1 hypothetical protein [Candidatus Neomarinimicrobiota bacterium]|tara:strand:+ start:667 stop:930 length:264 start_codon:yes stop_codon:yes gene_type:complete
MSENGNEQKKYKYMVTMRWYVETDEELVSGSQESDQKLLDLVRHRSNGEPCLDDCPTRNNEGYAVLDYHYFMGNKEPYMSTEMIKNK